VDSDGTVCKKRGCVTFCNTNRRLAEDFRELVRSLGRKAGWCESRAVVNGKDCGPAYRVSFYHSEGARLPRKKVLCRDQWRTPDTYIDVMPAGIADTVCIEVDSPSHLFLCGKSMTPTHNSTYASVLFPAWLMARQPNTSIIGASHTSDLAEAFSKRVQSMVREHSDLLGYSMLNEAANLWLTSNGCQYKSAGVGGVVTGFRADVAIVDDPVKSRADAESDTYRERAYNWYKADLLTRLKPGGAVILIQTRWHMDDLSGRLIEDDPNGWEIIKLPAIAEENDPLGREPGEPLWQDDEYGYGKQLQDIRRQVGERDWFSLYQQSPRPLEGSIFKTAQISIAEAVPAGTTLVRAWDLASTEDTGGRDPDWTVGALLGRKPDGALIIVDLVRVRGGPDEVEAAIIATASRDGKRVEISLPQDPGQAGVVQIKYLTRKLYGYKVNTSRETGKKATRAGPFSSQVNVGNVSMLKANWNRPLIDEMGAFPSGSHDDMVDALSRAFGELIDQTAVDRFKALAS
jgi:predicted phage terminase large subunit-like protein